MDPIVRAVLTVLMRWIHILSVITLLGGMIYARYVLAPALAALDQPAREATASRAAAIFRPFILLTLATILGSGVYNLVTKSNIPPNYHIWFGVKMLFVLHIFAVAFLLARSSMTEEKRNRLTASVVLSGIIVVAISAWLRFLTNWYLA